MSSVTYCHSFTAQIFHVSMSRQGTVVSTATNVQILLASEHLASGFRQCRQVHKPEPNELQPRFTADTMQCDRGAQLISQIVPEIFLEGKFGATVGFWGLFPQCGPGAKSLVRGSGGSW